MDYCQAIHEIPCVLIIYGEEYFTNLDELRKYVSLSELRNYIDNEVHPIREHIIDCWIKNYEGHLDRLGDHGSEAKHASYCARIPIDGYIEPVKQIVQCLERSKDMAKELDMSRYRDYAEVLIDVVTLHEKGRHEDAKALLVLSPEGWKIWSHASTESAKNNPPLTSCH